MAQNGVSGTPRASYGIGCVGYACSPGTSDSVGTVVSTIGWIGSPVSRCHMYSRQFLPAAATPLIGLPSGAVTSNSVGPVTWSKSHRSWWIAW